MLDTLVPGCGNSDDTASPVDVSSYSEMWWQNNEYKEGFLESHHGPCEAWIDDTKVFHYDDCSGDSNRTPPRSQRITRLATESESLSFIENCVPISNGGSGTSTSTTASSTTGNEAYNFSMTESTTTTAPQATTAAPQSN
ncbi:hypothetical protein V7S43_011377 [Phytophthora oleae]|uniref:Uncharacterized protein n=1 Tax=Phytophthora oleae TaxID=2107226 RepID=A0ABD3FDD1_9STRA